MGSISDKLEYLLDTKEQLKSALIDKSVDIDDNTTFRNFAIKTTEDTGLVDTSDATASINDIATNQTAYVNGQKLTGTINIVNTITDTDPDNFMIQPNFMGMPLCLISGKVNPQTSTGRAIVTNNTNLDAVVTHSVLANGIGLYSNILKQGVNILGVEGNVIASNEETGKIITPLTIQQNIEPNIGYTGFANVVVAPVTNLIDVNITPENIKNGVNILGTIGNLSSGGDSLYENLFKTLYATEYVENTTINLTLPNVEILSRSFTLPNQYITYPLNNYRQSIVVNLHYVLNRLPDTLKYMYANLGKGSVIDTNNITELPSNLEVLDSPIFYGASITNINLPNCLKILNSSTFAWSKITTIDLSNVEFIGDYVFNSCNNLGGQLLTPNVYYVGLAAFGWCSNITGILNFPNLKYLRTRATDHCDNITDIRIGNRGLATGSDYQLNTQFYGCNGVHGIFINEPGIAPNFSYFTNTYIPSNYIVYSNHPLYVNEYDTNKYLDILFHTNRIAPNVINVSDLNIQLLNNTTPLTPILSDNHYVRYVIDQDNLNLNLSVTSANYNTYTETITTQVSNRIAQRKYIFLDSSTPVSNYKLTIYMEDPQYPDNIEVYDSETCEQIQPDSTEPWVYTVEDGQTYDIAVQSVGYEPYNTQCSVDGQDLDIEVWMNLEMNPEEY